MTEEIFNEAQRDELKNLMREALDGIENEFKDGFGLLRELLNNSKIKENVTKKVNNIDYTPSSKPKEVKAIRPKIPITPKGKIGNGEEEQPEIKPSRPSMANTTRLKSSHTEEKKEARKYTRPTLTRRAGRLTRKHSTDSAEKDKDKNEDVKAIISERKTVDFRRNNVGYRSFSQLPGTFAKVNKEEITKKLREPPAKRVRKEIKKNNISTQVIAEKPLRRYANAPTRHEEKKKAKKEPPPKMIDFPIYSIFALNQLSMMVPELVPNELLLDKNLTLVKTQKLVSDITLLIDQNTLKIKELEANPAAQTEPVIDIGAKEAYLEVEPGDEIDQFYANPTPTHFSILIMEILAGLLNHWELIDPEKKNIENILAYLKQEADKNVGIYLLKKLRNNEFDFRPENLYKLRQLLKGENLSDKIDFGEDLLIGILYLALVSPILKTIGFIGDESAFYTLQCLTYLQEKLSADKEMIEQVISETTS